MKRTTQPPPTTTTKKPKQEPNEEEEEEDDYMSMTFEDTSKPSKQLTYSEKRRKALEASKAKGSVKSTKEKEVEAREIGLKTNVLSNDNKGFGMLEKLGFKKGMTLGRDDSLSTKLHEPIAVTIKSGLGGLGMDSLRREMHESHQKQAQETVQQTEQEFRASAAKKREEARSYGELMKARKALQSLDEGAGLTRTEFWIPEPKKKLLTDDYSLSSIKSQVLESRGEYYKELATDAEVEAGIDAIEEPESAFEQLETFEKLVQVTNHLRATYFYCLWCGDKYSNKDELESLCPGPTRDDHDLD